jgi:ABC-type lipopolysaccharide export system ATPase subunit
LAILPQDHLIPPYIKISEAIKNFNISTEEIIELMPVVKDWLNLKPDECSGGSLRLVETMIILLSDKPFCFLDEPFSGLMPLHIELVKKIILAEKKRKGIIISDHLYLHVKSITDKIYVLSNCQTYLMKNEEHLVKYGYLNKI